MNLQPPTDEQPFRLVNTDCRDVLSQLSSWGERLVLVTDPPYGINLQTFGWSHKNLRQREGSIQGDKNLDVAQAILEWAEEKDLPTVCFASPYLPLPGEWRNVLVWDKGPCVGAGGDYETSWKRSFELIYVTRNGPLSGGREPAVLPYQVTPTKDFALHPCQKPVELLRYLIRKVTSPDDIVVDPCAGSGSTLVASLLEGRRCVGIEVDPVHFGVARARVKGYVGPFYMKRKIFPKVSGDVDLFGHPLGK